MSASFNAFVDAALIEASSLQDGPRSVPLELLEFSHRQGVPKVWADNAAQVLRNYGDILPDSDDPEKAHFIINGLGMERAAKIASSGDRQISSGLVHIHNTVSPNISQSVSVAPALESSSASATRAGWIGAWGTWAGALFAVIAVLVTLHLAGKI